jgi:hypothetical protein
VLAGGCDNRRISRLFFRGERWGNGESARCMTPAGDIDRELAATIDQGNLTVVFTATYVVLTSAATPANGLAG